MNKFIIAALVCAALALATPVVKRQAAEPKTLQLPDGADIIVGEIATSFSCDDRIYGYYADVANRCQVFHVCAPYSDGEGYATVDQFSFFCGNQTVFDQRYMTCAHADLATPCEEAESYYSLNENFGKTEDTE